ncbi:ubiquitin carboxyl-terminal hydrolase-like [Agrilus planipennis]|uniref:Ubiquitin carboxyl-terminal hydrolase n=1 Tax=Agrilus planipennis TaxID=224129 RepID=A0A1W4WEI9_AGRPL|nr:ubiquitin carboxyl-terminal hydrolase-like [Agrilus planipennis]
MNWLPLESNPDVLNKLMQRLGVPKRWNVVDVYGLDRESLQWVPRPVLSVILLYPCNDKINEYMEEKCKEIKDKGQVISPQPYFFRQTAANACGTAALIHSIANNRDQIVLNEGGLKKALEETENATPEERGELLQSNCQDIVDAHKELAGEGQTQVNADEGSSHHFIALVHNNGYLYELDGKKEFPINHGPTEPGKLLEDAAKVCKEYIEKAENDINFSVMALTSCIQ